MRQIYLKYEITPQLESTHSRDGYGHACKKNCSPAKGPILRLRIVSPQGLRATMSCMAPWLITKGPGGPPWCTPWGHTLVAHNAHFYDRFITRRPRPDNALPTGARFNFLLGSSSSHWHPCISYQHCSCVLLHLPDCLHTDYHYCMLSYRHCAAPC